MTDANAKGIIDDLLKRHDDALREIRELRGMIRKLSEMYGETVTLPGLDDQGQVSRAENRIRPGVFFGMSQTDAVAAFLELTNEPKTMEEILAGLEEGGCQVGGKDPRATVYTQVIRATHRFVKLPSNHFGLLEWYPEIKAKRSSKRKKKSKNDSHQEADESAAVETVAPTEDGHSPTVAKTK